MPAPKGNAYAEGQGRPTSYRAAYNKQAYLHCLLGATDEDLAKLFSVTEQTINNWKEAHPSFFESIKKGKDIADAKVAQALFARATGYSHPDTHFSVYEGTVTATPTVKHYQPDTAAAVFWLKNRQKSKWRDKVEVETTHREGAKLKAWTAEEIDAFEQFQQNQQSDGGN